jgi:DNA gyrase subunit A
MTENVQKQEKEIGYIKPREISEEMKESYLDYAMSVIISRALPDVRDGLKPVHRRILYAMYEMGLRHNTKFRKSATVVGECFVKDTMILTEKGLVPIQEIKVEDEVYTQTGLQKVARLYEMPKKPLLKVTLENGFSNTVTPSQKFKVLTPDWKFEWREVKDLTKNDYLVIRADYPEISNLVELNLIEENQPRYLNESMAYLLGLFVSDGWISEDYGRKKLPRIGFTAGINKEIATKVVSIFKQEFNYIPTIETKSYRYLDKQGRIFNNKQYTLRINRKAINEFFVSNFSLKRQWALTKKIPLQIFNSPQNIIFSFISGLIEGDGCISSKRNVIHYGSISEKLISQLQILLQHQGIFSSKYVDKNLNKSHSILGKIIKKRHRFHYLEIHGENAIKLASNLNLAAEIKNQRACNLSCKKITSHERKGWNKYDLIPYGGKILFQELSDNHLGAGWYQDLTGNKFRMGIKYPNGGCKIRYSADLWEKPLRKTQVVEWGIKEKLNRMGSPLLDFLNHIIKNKIYFLKVTSIRKIASQKTYDFQVQNDHEFIANGVVSHNCLGKFHPHGDVALYDALVRMAQDFSLRYPLIQGQGNFGSIDDPSEFAAMRYTESRLSLIGEGMLQDIEKDTVDFRPNYDGTKKEPVVLPSPVPQLLINGSLGIAVGMATNIPPHNLSEICDATIYLINHAKATTEDLFQFVKGPDFPTGGIIYGKKDIISAYSQGKGPILIRGKAEIQEQKKGFQIIISEIPFQVQKSELLRQIAKLVEDKKIDGIKDVRDESDKEGMRIVIELKPGSFPKKVLNGLYTWTSLQRTFHLNMLALVDGIQPKILSLADVLSLYLVYKEKVIKRRITFDLARAKERGHILEGLNIAQKNIDKVIATIKKSANRNEAQKNLEKKFKLTSIQANAILEMKLQSLAKLERETIEKELKEIKSKIKELSLILKSPRKIKELVKKEIKEVKEKYGDDRRTKAVVGRPGEIGDEDLIPKEETIIILTKGGYVKRIKPSIYKVQQRGGKGILGMGTGKEDFVEHFSLTNTLDNLLFFTNSGKVFQTQVFEIPESSRISKGRGLLNFLEISQEEKIMSLVPYSKKDIEEGVKYLMMVTKNGIIKKTNVKDFQNVRRSGLIAINLGKEDALKGVAIISEGDEIILVTKNGKSIRFKQRDIRPMGRTAAGVRGIRLSKGDEVLGMDIIKPQTSKTKVPTFLLVIMENGYGKRTKVREYRLQRRGGTGIKTARITEKTGKIVFSKIVGEEEKDLLVISKNGQVIRLPLGSISIIGRASSGVRVMRLTKGDNVASAVCL